MFLGATYDSAVHFPLGQLFIRALNRVGVAERSVMNASIKTARKGEKTIPIGKTTAAI